MNAPKIKMKTIPGYMTAVGWQEQREVPAAGYRLFNGDEVSVESLRAALAQREKDKASNHER